MNRFDPGHYLNTPEGLLAQHWRRRMRRIHFDISDVEPRAKHSMSERDKDHIQEQLLKSLTDLRRRAFRGPLAMRLVLQTTDKNPTHSHHIAKNLLDLLGKPRPTVATARRGLLYTDDRQVHALAVTCHHGEMEPKISVVACPLSDLLEELDLAIDSGNPLHHNSNWNELYELDMATEQFVELLREETTLRDSFGNRAFQSLLGISRWRVQELLLGRAAVTPSDVARMYNISGRISDVDVANIWEQTFASAPLRIRLSELPHVNGASARWKREIDEKLCAFQAKFERLINPLLVPVALEVVVKPPQVSRLGALHDLDNVLRNYLIPRVVGILKPVSHYAFTLDAEPIKSDAPELLSNTNFPERSDRLPRPPPSTKSGVTRYEAWRLPPANEGSQGFVSMAIVTDMTGYGDIFGKIDDAILKWRETLDA